MDNVEIMDELGQEIVAEQLKSLHRELSGFEDNLKQVLEAKENYEPQWEIDKRLYEIMIEGHRKIEAQHEFEKNDEYWELRKRQLEYKFRQEKHLAESRINGYNIQIEALTKQVNSNKTKIDELERS